MAEQRAKTIAVFGGSFNPPHLGHAHAIKTILKFFPCDEVWVMPSDSRRDKIIGVSGADRLAMLRIMIKELFYDRHCEWSEAILQLNMKKTSIPITVSSFELDRHKPTSTYETLRELRRLHPNNTFYFMVNSDVVGDIRAKWVNGEKLFIEGHFLVMHRPPFEIPKELPPHTVVLHDAPSGLPITSTEIRRRVATGETINDYVTSGVAQYITRCKLYR